MPSEPRQRAPRVLRTLCPTCRGAGGYEVLVASTSSTRQVLRVCEQCDGVGRLPGFHPPV